MKLATDSSDTAAGLDGLLARMRPKLHRYCARMTGSVIDGEDVLQDALIKAVESFAAAGPIGNPEGWLFRIAHNTALDFLRRRHRQDALHSAEEMDMIADPVGCRDQPPDRGRQPSHLHAAAGRPAFQRDPGGRARLLAERSLRRPGFQPAGGQGGAASRTYPAARTGRASRTICRWQNCRTPIASASAPMSRISTPAISTRSAP